MKYRPGNGWKVRPGSSEDQSDAARGEWKKVGGASLWVSHPSSGTVSPRPLCRDPRLGAQSVACCGCCCMLFSSLIRSVKVILLSGVCSQHLRISSYTCRPTRTPQRLSRAANRTTGYEARAAAALLRSLLRFVNGIRKVLSETVATLAGRLG